jgi:hypothetical protein
LGKWKSLDTMVCHHLNVKIETKLAKELHLLIIIKSTLARNQLEQKNGTNLTTNIIHFKINVLETLDILTTPR